LCLNTRSTYDARANCPFPCAWVSLRSTRRASLLLSPHSLSWAWHYSECTYLTYPYLGCFNKQEIHEAVCIPLKTVQGRLYLVNVLYAIIWRTHWQSYWLINWLYKSYERLRHYPFSRMGHATHKLGPQNLLIAHKVFK